MTPEVPSDVLGTRKFLVCEGACPPVSMRLSATTVSYQGHDDAKRVPHDLQAKEVRLAVTTHRFARVYSVRDSQDRVTRRDEVYTCEGCGRERVFGVMAPFAPHDPAFVATAS